MDNLLVLLNSVLKLEYYDVFLYLKESELFRKKIVDGDKVSIIFEEFCQMELKHADKIATKIIEIKGNPEWSFELVKPSSSLRDVLKNHLERELNALQIYDKIINIIDDRDFKIVLKGIRENEKEHLEKTANILKKLR